MIHRYTYQSLTWVDLESPTQEEVRGVMEEFGIDVLVAEELLTPTLRPRIDIRDDYFYLVLRFPALKHTHTNGTDQEIDFVVGKSWMITTHYDSIDPLHTFSKVFEVSSMVGHNVSWTHAGDMFFNMITTLYGAVSYELEHIEARLEKAEEDVFDGHEKEMVLSLSMIGRDLLDFKQALGPHKTTLDSLFAATEPLFDASFSKRIRAIVGEYYRIWNAVETQTASLHELRETNNSLLTTKQNETIKTFTILAFTTLPMTLVASVFGMNTTHAPFVGRPDDFWIVLAIMIILALLCLIYFKHKHWL
jgi:magnesium transporter